MTDDAIRAVCREWFGRYVGDGKWSPQNRCDACPLRTPCSKWGAAPAHTFEQLEEARAVFVVESEAVIAGGEQ